MTVRGDLHSHAIGRAFERRLRAFRALPVSTPAVHLETGERRLSSPRGTGRLIYQSPGVDLLYFEDAGELYVDHPAGVRLRCHPASGRIQLSFTADDRLCLGLATHPLFTVALIEVLKHRGRFSVHAAAAAIGDRGVLVAGPSGAGKSTLSVAMARSGMAFLGDDTVFLAWSAGSASAVDVLGFPDEVDVTAETIAMYPELSTGGGELSMNGREKRALRLEEAITITTTLRCRPAALVFPRVAHTDRSVVEPISAREAVVALAPNVLLTDPSAAEAHLDILSTLVRTTPTFRLATGTDLAPVPELLAGLADLTG